ncbi:unnamed protein product (macronuclear) [Paramecium tetraurelia]|uniref:Uncharacterized protein n=1 Tax=Paramecium tetraurelia TaxID=5888 RepID=A0C2S6_PARTE|nr:uncharacterized protein GSPATT00034571001 [Paramecium tetraurelia]CAK65093.1 unnamed protein product [Paramecium tetraurelia]|eukprot:XP_001432490.1 hypothetical protein (macronuclear) [Paramecium tetraurelia strain d4-2]
MELLNNEEREMLAKYNRYLTNDKIQEPLKYSDIFMGKHDLNDIPQKTEEKKIQNQKLQIKTSSANKRDQFKNIINELNNVQSKQLENIFKSSSVFEETQKEKQYEECEVQVFKDTTQQKTNKNSDRPEKQPKQSKSSKSLSKEQIKKKQDSKPKKNMNPSNSQTTIEIQQEFNEYANYSQSFRKLLQQLNKLIQLKKVDNKFFFSLISKHVNECPSFGKRLKEEIKEILNQLL